MAAPFSSSAVISRLLLLAALFFRPARAGVYVRGSPAGIVVGVIFLLLLVGGGVAACVIFSKRRNKARQPQIFVPPQQPVGAPLPHDQVPMLNAPPQNQDPFSDAHKGNAYPYAQQAPTGYNAQNAGGAYPQNTGAYPPNTGAYPQNTGYAPNPNQYPAASHSDVTLNAYSQDAHNTGGVPPPPVFSPPPGPPPVNKKIGSSLVEQPLLENLKRAKDIHAVHFRGDFKNGKAKEERTRQEGKTDPRTNSIRLLWNLVQEEVEVYDWIHLSFRLIAFSPAVPTEIMAEIFCLCDPFSAGGPRCSLATPLSTPMLWRMLYINLGTDTAQSLEGAIQLMLLILARSAACPMSVVMEPGNLDIPQNQPFLDRVMRSSDRWEALTIYVKGPVTLRAISKIRGRLPLLRRLELYPDQRLAANLGTFPFHIDMFADTPCLRSVVCIHYEATPSLILPWNQLTEYTTNYDGEELDSLVTVLEKLTNLITLNIKLGGFGEVGRPFVQSTITSDAEPGALMDRLLLPALTSLALECDNTSTSVCPHLASLISRSGCRLASLIIELYPPVDATIATVLHLTPQLTHLTLGSSMRIEDGLLSLLTSRSELSAATLAPLLASLTLRGPFDQMSLLTLATARTVPSGVLKELEMLLKPVDIEPAFANGMDVISNMGLVARLLQ
ncbi:hypothetical protein C8R43DRAFT_1105546 [Mycena crocata]|nr:hypothetical protein C8R43DRAFT_1105546 [Mycena crocata]